MPDYSGYAQRQQQDPNLAAWANISGNIANIFGLDPAKAAEARRGLQQEQYNEERNQAYLRQKLANQRMGELLKRLNPATGEFDNPADYREYAGITGELGGNPHTSYGTGFGEAQLQMKINAENRALENRLKAKAAENAAAETKAENDKSKEVGKAWTNIDKTGHSKVVVAPDVAVETFFTLLQKGGNGGRVLPYDQSKGFSVVTPDTRGLPEKEQRRVMTQDFTNWSKSAGYDSTAYPEEINHRMRTTGTNLRTEHADVLAALEAKFTDPNTGKLLLNRDQLSDLARRIVARELTTLHEENKGKADKTARITGQKEMDEFLRKQASLKPEDRAETVLYRVPVPGSLSNEHTYSSFNVAALLNPDNLKNKKHPLFAQ